MTQEALKLALEFLEDNQHFIETYERPEYLVMYNDVIEKCKEALAQTQEPVAWAHYQTFDEIDTLQRSRFKATLAKKQTGACSIPLYTNPPQRTWVGLDLEEIRKTNHHMVEGAYHYSFKQGAEWAEAKLKEKNA